MRGVTWFGQPCNVFVINLPVPAIVNQTDVVVRITSSAVCGSDLHMYHGFGGSPKVPYGFGQEAVGYISSIGDSVTSLSVGDYVIIPETLTMATGVLLTLCLSTLVTQTTAACMVSLHPHIILTRITRNVIFSTIVGIMISWRIKLSFSSLRWIRCSNHDGTVLGELGRRLSQEFSSSRCTQTCSADYPMTPDEIDHFTAIFPQASLLANYAKRSIEFLRVYLKMMQGH
ncbi:alcohol dehydrogenase GroES-like domain-containing protein [Colletotrichum asianum]|uniref:Alcohol dehydrogenase GroES-like domain-containing protein n=1 Tax=Colletotrichum asianum TaxID=702518 RepID=A0A8H3WE77_9PEZI|nr:alcohol dehydrogenase GroES-like domain-containing protein [Colletotrichum asianum]